MQEKRAPIRLVNMMVVTSRRDFGWARAWVDLGNYRSLRSQPRESTEDQIHFSAIRHRIRQAIRRRHSFGTVAVPCYAASSTKP